MSEARWGGQPPADLVPENAPFDEEQRAWLNGFLAGLLGLANGGDGPGAAPRAPTGAPPAADSPGRESLALTPEERQALSEDEGRQAAERARRARPERPWTNGGTARRSARTTGADAPASSGVISTGCAAAAPPARAS